MSDRRRLMMQSHGKNGIMKFEDPEVERICVENWGSDGHITYEQAAEVHDFGSAFLNSKIQHFPEAKQFGIDKRTTSMEKWFFGCGRLVDIDVSTWDVSNVTNMYNLFNNCYSLSELDVKKWDMENVERAGGMFGNCHSLKTLDVSRWKLSNMKNASMIFFNLAGVLAFDTTHFTFENCGNLMYCFRGMASVQSLDLSNVDTTKCGNFNGFVQNTDSLKKIKVSSSFFNSRATIELNAPAWDDVESITHMVDVLPKKSNPQKLILSDTTKAVLTEEQKENIKNKNWILS